MLSSFSWRLGWTAAVAIAGRRLPPLLLGRVLAVTSPKRLPGVYADVPTCFATWRQQGRPIAIYSSGSVLAQKLLFRHSVAGDLTGFLSGHYDTTSGSKREPASYATIANAGGKPATDITFCTDQPAEAEAAAAAGMVSVLLMRPGNAPLPAGLRFPVHADLTKV